MCVVSVDSKFQSTLKVMGLGGSKLIVVSASPSDRPYPPAGSPAAKMTQGGPTDRLSAAHGAAKIWAGTDRPTDPDLTLTCTQCGEDVGPERPDRPTLCKSLCRTRPTSHNRPILTDSLDPPCASHKCILLHVATPSPNLHSYVKPMLFPHGGWPMAAGPASRLGSIEPGDKTGLRLSPHLAPST